MYDSRPPLANPEVSLPLKRLPVLACAKIAEPEHIVDLWRDPASGGWCVGNDDRSLSIEVPPTYSDGDALDAYCQYLLTAGYEADLSGCEATPGEGFTPEGYAFELDDPPTRPAETIQRTAFDDIPPDGAAFRVGNMGAFRAACLRAADGEELDLSGCDITPLAKGEA